MQFAWGFAPPLILEAALSYRVFDLLDKAAMTAVKLAQRTGASVRGMGAILDALVGLGFLQRQGAAYALTPESATFLVSTRPAYHGAYFMHMTRQLIPRWLYLKDAVRSGRPVLASNQANEGPLFFAQFVESLFPLNYAAAKQVGEHLRVHRLSGAASVLDIGAGSGVWGIALAHLSPHVRVLAVDWPEVLEVTRKVARRHGILERLDTRAGDLLEADFGSGHHIAAIGHILHSEGVAKSSKLLRKAFAALRPGGTIVISEFTANADRTGPSNALIFAVNMLLHTEEGSTYSFEEISQWLEKVGFVNVRQLQASAPSPLILANRP